MLQPRLTNNEGFVLNGRNQLVGDSRIFSRHAEHPPRGAESSRRTVGFSHAPQALAVYAKTNDPCQTRRQSKPASRSRSSGSESSSSSSSSSSRISRWRTPNRGGRAKRRLLEVTLPPRFCLDIPPSRVHFVDSAEHLEAATGTLAKSVLVSIDTETQPCFEVGQWHPTSLLQIGTRDARGEEEVFVIDLLSLQERLRLPECLDAALGEPLGSPEVLKLGVGLMDDLDNMAFAFGETPVLEKIPSVLNLNVLHQMLTEDDLGPYGVGLRKLVHIYLGKTLSKRQQISSWARRPLTDAQVAYAASDTLVVLRVFDKMIEATGPLDLHGLSATWTPKSVPEEEMMSEKARQNLLRKIAARNNAVGREHILYQEASRHRG